jgi:hypothetical protein
MQPDEDIINKNIIFNTNNIINLSLKTTLKWPIECCDDGAAMAHNQFLSPDHWTHKCVPFGLFITKINLLCYLC